MDFCQQSNVSAFQYAVLVCQVCHKASLIAQLVRNQPAVQETCLIPGSGRNTGEVIGYPLQYSWASLVAQTVKKLPAVRETWVRSLSWEDPLEKRTATHFSILVWRIPWTEEPGRLQSMKSQRVMTEWLWLSLHFSLEYFITRSRFTVSFLPLLNVGYLSQRLCLLWE